MPRAIKDKIKHTFRYVTLRSGWLRLSDCQTKRKNPEVVCFVPLWKELEIELFPLLRVGIP